MMLKGFFRSLLPLSLVSTLAMLASTAGAASVCKGLDESSCKQNPSCNWINGYTTKNGNAVSAYCRSAGKQQGLNLQQKENPVSESPEHAATGVIRTTVGLEEKNG